MAESGIKVSVKWGSKKTSKTIKLSAKTLDGVLDQLNKRDEWGLFDGKIGYTYKADSSDIVTEVTLKPSYVIHMPVWSKYGSAPKDHKKEWDRMYKALAKHEDGHRLIHLEALAKIDMWLKSAKNLSDTEFMDKFEDMMTAAQKEQDKFDTSTGHGAKKGVRLDVP